jgi:uncharacterized membrane protein YccC
MGAIMQSSGKGFAHNRAVPSPPPPFAVLRELGGGLRHEARDFSLRNPRALQAWRPVLSVAIAVAAAHALGLKDSWWSAISAFIVMQEAFGASAYRGMLRIIGTLVGAGLGVLLGPILALHPVPFVLAMAAASWVGLFGGLRYKHSYAWVLGLITFVMVMGEAAAAPRDLIGFAGERVANVVVGTLACVIVAGLTEPRFLAALIGHRRPAPAPAGPAASAAPADLRTTGLHALHGAAAVVLVSIAVLLHDLPAFPQAMVTAVAVMIVPLGGGPADALESVAQRMVQRLAGCCAAGALAFALLPLIGQQPVWCQAALAVGTWAGAYLQRGAASVSYAAVQFAVAFLMVFVQDAGWTVNGRVALQRLVGIFAGILSLGLVIFVSRLLARRS